MTYAEQVAHDLDVARKALNEKYETDGWVWVASEVCQHGDPWSYTDKKAERVGTDGVVETVYVCNLMAKEFDPES